ncbi:DUF29 domain-containing protein, partial [Microcystis aeruginosa]|uniref:DUF29 domain-containing protein n=1 Tax=Microcystis aeruginosa TaxID=1126 RepID=UPI0021BEF72B
MTLAKVKNLYNQDFALWIEATVKQLKSGDLSQVDLENLIEEVESLGKSQRKAVDNFLTRLLEHLLKPTFRRLKNTKEKTEKVEQSTKHKYS